MLCKLNKMKESIKLNYNIHQITNRGNVGSDRSKKNAKGTGVKTSLIGGEMTGKLLLEYKCDRFRAGSALGANNIWK